MMMHDMMTRQSSLRCLVLFAAAGVIAFAPGLAARARAQVQAAAPTAAPAPGVLDRTQAAAILPPSVFYAGQSAPTQARNSAGIRFHGGKLALMALVDTSGYSSAVQQRYQAYLLTEVPLSIGGQTIRPGAYGFGYIANDRLVLMDIGGNELLHASTTRDDKMPRPVPLQIVADPSSPGTYRLYLGRSYATISAANLKASQ
jgi:hypothetical protein